MYEHVQYIEKKNLQFKEVFSLTVYQRNFSLIQRKYFLSVENGPEYKYAIVFFKIGTKENIRFIRNCDRQNLWTIDTNKFAF